MCRAVDIATYAISKSIDLRNESGDDRYYMDFYKVNKILYFADGIMWSKEDKSLFDEDIYAYACGPYIEELEFIFRDWEYEPIVDAYKQEIELPYFIANFIDNILKEYGRYDKKQLGIASKKQPPWLEAYEVTKNNSKPGKIDVNSIKNYFLSVPDLHVEIKDAK